MSCQDLIKGRRSVRKFKDTLVKDEEVVQLLDAARWAPSWMNTQCWEFIVVRDEDLIRQVVETFSPANPSRPCAGEASVLLVAAARRDAAGMGKDGRPSTEIQNWFMFDLGAAVQNISLAAYDMGLATVVVGSLDHARCAELLKVPADVQVAAVLPVGRPAQTPAPKPRKDLDEFVSVDHYGKRWALGGEEK
ncbi:MAG: nitroreductase family protein [Candidatus Omnitrophota bacterium]